MGLSITSKPSPESTFAELYSNDATEASWFPTRTLCGRLFHLTSLSAVISMELSSGRSKKSPR